MNQPQKKILTLFILTSSITLMNATFKVKPKEPFTKEEEPFAKEENDRQYLVGMSSLWCSSGKCNFITSPFLML